MIILVWYLLSRMGICGFSLWLAGGLDLLVSFLVCMWRASEASPSNDPSELLACYLLLPGSLFCLLKGAGALLVSGWWVLAAPLVLTAAIALPGGFTLLAWLLARFGLVTGVAGWMWVVCIVLDLLTLAALIIAALPSRK